MSLRAEVSSLPRPVWVLFAGTLVNRLGGFVLFFLILYLRQKGYSVPQAGLALSAYGVGGVAAAFIGGHLADRIGRRNTIVVSMFLSSATVLALSQEQALSTVVVVTALTGLSAELYRPAASALVADLTAPGERVTAFAVYRIAVNLGVAVGPAMGGFLVDRSFFSLFVIDAVTSALFALIALFALPNTRGEPATGGKPRGSVRVILEDRGFLVFLAASLLGSIVFMQFNGTLPLQIRAHGFPNSLYGIMMSINGALVLIFELPLSSLTRRRPAPGVMALGLLLIGLGFSLTGANASPVALIVAVIVWTSGEIVFVPVAAAYVANIAPGDMRGRYQGMWAGTWSASHILAPALGTAVFAVSPPLLWSLCAATGLVAAMVMLAVAPARAHN